MNFLKYYFSLDFEWNGNFSEGIPKVKFFVNPSKEIKGSVNFEILEVLFLSNKKLHNVNYLESLIEDIKRLIDVGDKTEIMINGSGESLEINKDYTRPIDDYEMYGSEPTDGGNSWNLTTPKDLQYIPTGEILVLFRDWKNFLIQKDKVKLKYDR